MNLKLIAATAFMAVLTALSLHAQTVLFSEDFAGGIPASWSNTSVACDDPDSLQNAKWVWTATGALKGAYWNASRTIVSPTVANGAVGFDSDFLDTKGVVGNFGNGAAPSPQTADLISPTFSCAGFSAVQLEFYQSYRNFQATPSVQVSSDNGATWTSFPVNTTIGGNASTIGLVALDISSAAANKASVKIKFRWEGDYYFWIIDDVRVTTLPDNDLAMGDYLFPVRNRFTPASQVGSDTMFFEMGFSNIGAATQSNVRGKVEVFDAANTLVFADSATVGNVASSASGTVNFPNFYYTNTIAQGAYSVKYSVASDSADYNPTNNVVTRTFTMTDTLYAKESGATGGLRPGSGGNYTVANYYKVSPTVSDGEYLATTATFACAKNSANGPLAGSSVTIFLVEINPTLVDENFNGFNLQADLFTNAALTIVGSADFTFTNQTNYQLITVPLRDLNTNAYGVELKQGGRYFLAIQYLGSSNVIFQAFNNTVNYFQISTATFSSQWFLGGFGEEQAAVLRMGISKSLCSPANKVQTSYTSTPFGCGAGSIDLSAIGGASPYTYTWSNGATSQDISNLAAGTYTVTVTSAGGCVTTDTVVVLQATNSVSAVPNSTTQVRFGWNKYEGAVSYRIRVRPVNGSFKFYTVTGNTKVISGFAAGQSYEYSIRADCAITGSTAWTPLKTFTMPSNATGCATPQYVWIDAKVATFIYWNFVPSATSYRLRYREVGSNTWTNVSPTTNTRKLNLPAGKNYEFQLRSACANNVFSAFSQSYYFSTPAAAKNNQPVVAIQQNNSNDNIFETTNAAFDLFPNPTKDVLNVALNEEFSSLEVTDLLGRTLQTLQVTNTVERIEIGNLPSGSYLLVARTALGGRVSKLFVKE